ncbi:MAG TPA: hypothetical protein ENI64_07575 [Gammaproteobacteria bacterium]|mgnify:CR=1 FL=1|nr:hypothetical protein [Gammaproteobacteria bacterium]
MKGRNIVISSILVLSVASIPFVWSDDDSEEWQEYSRHSTGVAKITNPVYLQECGDCHMAYPAGLLPADAWQRVMNGLEDHFGDNAELDPSTRKQITDYLIANSADKSDYRRSQRFAKRDKKSNDNMRITETPYFRHEHNEILARLVITNKEVNSFSNCNSCHQKAEQASFKERDILIPGYGRWDD